MRLSAEQIEAIKQDAEKFHGVVQVRLFDRQVGVNQNGFTLVELVMTMVIVGIIAAVAVPRFSGSSVFQSRGFADQVQASLRYAQKIAIAQRRFVCVSFTATTVSLSTGTTFACSGGALPSLTGGGNYVITSPASSITISSFPATLYFNGLGRPNAGAPVVIGSSTITVEAETGYVHSP
jgi:MSHA pilin protein MshC